MNVGLAARLAFPGKCAVGKVNLDAESLEKLVPENADLFALVMELVETKPTTMCVPWMYSAALKYQPVT